MHYVQAKGILSAKNGMNLYRGCPHGCIYCDSRSKCYHMEHDFEDIEVMENAIELPESALRRKRQKCMIGTGSMTEIGKPILIKEKSLCRFPSSPGAAAPESQLRIPAHSLPVP